MSRRVCLTMMVKDEAEGIRACLESAIPYIDTWVILDTGSTDGTQDIITETLFDIPGRLHHGDYVDFGTTRSQLMALARGVADYLLLLDADTVIEYDRDTIPDSTADVLEGTIRQGTIEFALPILVRGDRDWRYEGVAHSYLATDGAWTSEPLPGFVVVDKGRVTVEKLRRDLGLLSAEHARSPLDARSAFYLAQTYYDLDMVPEAIAMYRYRANLSGWDEETYYARYRLGSLLCEHVSFAQGAKELLAAWEMRPSRVESLHALAASAVGVAAKAGPSSDRLFVHHALYPAPKPAPIQSLTVPPVPNLDAGTRRRYGRKLQAKDVSAIVVTRGNVDLEPILSTLPYEDVVIWNNSDREHDYRVFGRYAAIPETTNPVVYFQDDDVVFTAHDELMAAYERGKLVANMDTAWVQGAGYGDFLALLGAGSLCPAGLPAKVFGRYLAEWPFDEDLLLECDFAFGVLAPSKRVDLGYEARPFTDDPDRLYLQPGQMERKWAMINRCRAMVAGERIAA